MNGTPINGTGRLLEIATCRGCGATGMEDPAIDPAPGWCPDCFQKKIEAEMAGVVARELARLDLEDAVPLDQRLRAAGAPMLPGLDL